MCHPPYYISLADVGQEAALLPHFMAVRACACLDVGKCLIEGTSTCRAVSGACSRLLNVIDDMQSQIEQLVWDPYPKILDADGVRML